MSLKSYYISKIDYKFATEIIIKNHYLHRKAPCSYAFGLFKKDDIFDTSIKGVIIYGTPSSAPLRRGIAGDEHKNNVIELTRLWVDDSVPKNGESFLIGNTLKLIEKEIVVSYAEIAQGHIGTIYQATNWLYTGLSAKRTNWNVDGINIHNQSLTDKYNSKEIKELFGDKFSLEERPRKHRYVYLRGNKWRKQELLKSLKYEILPYPKKDQYNEK